MRLLTIILFLAALSRLALADGVMISVRETGRANEVASSPKQEAVLISNPDAQSVTVILRTHFHAGPRELAWLIPVPAPPTAIESRDDALFTELNVFTVPRFLTMQDRGGFHFGCAATPASEAVAFSAHVRHEATGTAGIYHYDVLGGTDTTTSQDITAWLFAHHYNVPPNLEPALEPYLKQHCHFLALQLRPETAELPTLAPHPISYTYGAVAGMVTFPLIISRPSASAQNEVLLYTLAPTRLAPAHSARGWKHLSLPEYDVALTNTTASGTTYELQLQSPADPHTFTTEFAGSLDNVNNRALLHKLLKINTADARVSYPAHYLTRLRAVISPDTMDRDLLLLPTNAPDVNPQQFISPPHARSSLSPIFLLVIPLVILKSRRLKSVALLSILFL